MSDRVGATRKPLHYHDFNLRLAHYDQARRIYRVWVEGQAPGGAMSPDDAVTCAYDPKAFWKDPDLGTGGLLGKLDRSTLPKEGLFQLGALLADLALPKDKVRPLLDKSLAALRDGEGLRLRLHVDAPELAQLPWEYMQLPQAAGEPQPTDFLALRREISIVRTDTVGAAARSLPDRIPRIVAVLSRPEDQEKLNVGKDKQALEAAVKAFNQAAGQEVITVAWVEKPASRTKLEQELQDGADVFQYSGHGTFELNQEGKLVLEDDDGEMSDFDPAELLATLLRNASVRLVLLGACEAGRRNGRMAWSGMAPALTREKIPAVIANQFNILDTSAILLAARIYPRLLSGYTVDEALFEARQAIFQQKGIEENRDWGVPVLYLQDDTGILFPLPEKAAQKGRRKGKAWQVPRMQPPRQDTPLLGRDKDLNLALATLHQGGKVYFHGTYGVGKTSLAAELYRQAAQDKPFSDGCLWYQVAKLSAQQVLERIAEKFPGQEVSQAKTPEEKIASLSELLSEHGDLLIGLDEVTDRSVAQDVLRATGNVTVICNGTQRLDSHGKFAERRLGPLSPSQAIQLFKSLAEPAAGRLTAEHMILVRKICERMRYLPLAVKLAALRFAEGTESLQSLWARLQNEPESLDDPSDGVVAILNTYYQDREQAPTAWQLLVQIASFPASEAPESKLDAGQADFYSAKDRLVNLGLVDYSGTDRLALHPLLGTQVQRVEPQAVQAEREHTVNWLLLYARDHTDNYDALEQERANLLGLLDWFTENSQWDRMVGLLRDLFDYLRVQGQWEEAFRRLETVLRSADEIGQPWNRAWAYLHRGIMYTLRGDYELAESDVDRADRMFAEVGDQPWRGKALYRHAMILIIRGEMDRARLELEQSTALMGDADPLRSTQADAYERLGEMLATQGELELAQQQFKMALARANTEGQARTHLALGELARRMGDYPEAQAQFDAATQLIDTIHDALQRAALEERLGYFYYYQGRYDDALRTFEAASAIYVDLKYPPGLASAQHALGNVALIHQDLELARGHYEKALEINTIRRQTANAAFNQYQLALVAERQGRLDEAQRGYEEALRAARQMKKMGLQAAALHQLSGLALTRGDLVQGVEYNQQAASLAAEAGDRLTEVSAQYYRGLLQAREGHLQAAQETLASAHAAFVALNAPQADAVAAILQKLQEGSLLDIDAIATGRVVVHQSVGSVGVGGVVVGACIDSVAAGHVIVGEHIDVVEEGAEMCGVKIQDLG